MRYEVIYSHVSEGGFFFVVVVLFCIVYNEVPPLFIDILEFGNVINHEDQLCVSNFSLYRSEGI